MAIELANDKIICPRGNGDGAIIIDMGAIAKLESRIQEVQFATPLKAPELLAVFNDAWLTLQKHVIHLEGERLAADRVSRARRSVVVLDEAPKVLKDKGLLRTGNPGGSEDMRQAVLDGDEDYQNKLQLVYEITCVIDLFKAKAKAFEMAYHSVKKIVDLDRYIYAVNSNLSGGTGVADVGQTNKSEMGGFGEPDFSERRY